MLGMTPKLDLVTILGCTPEEAAELLCGRPVTAAEAEAAARFHLDWRRHGDDPDSYWVTITQASRMLGLRPKVIRKMLDTRRLPHITHDSGVRLMRRHEIQAIATHQETIALPALSSMAGA